MLTGRQNDCKWMNTTQYCPQTIQYMAQYTVDIILCNSYTDRLGQGWQTSGTRQDFLGRRHSLLSQFTLISFALPGCLYGEGHASIYTHLIAYRLHMNYRCYQTTLQCNIILHKSWAVPSFHWVFTTGVPVWRRLGEYVTRNETFYCLIFKQEVVAGPITSTLSSLLHFSTKPLLEV